MLLLSLLWTPSQSDAQPITGSQSQFLRRADTLNVIVTKKQLTDAINAASFGAGDTVNVMATKSNIQFLQDSITWLHTNTSAAVGIVLSSLQLTNTRVNDSLSNHLYWLGYLRGKASTHDAQFLAMLDSILSLRNAINNLPDSVDTLIIIDDKIAPTQIVNLSVTAGPEGGQATLGFTAPNANPGNAKLYDIRYASQNITEYGDSGSGGAQAVIQMTSSVRGDVPSVLTLAPGDAFDGTANNMLVCVIGGYGWSVWDVDSVVSDIDGQFTEQVSATRSDHNAYIYTLDEPTAGTYTVRVYITGSGYVSAGLYRVSDVASIRTVNSNTGVAASLSSVDISNSVSGELIIDVHSLDADVALNTATWGDQQSEMYLVYADGMNDGTGGSSYRSGASGTVTMSLDYHVSTEEFAACAIALNSVTGSSGTTKWDDAAQYTGEPLPKTAGSAESITLSGLPAQTFYFAIKSSDSSGNVSAFSNVDNATVPAEDPFNPPDTTEWRGGYGWAYADTVISGDKWADRNFGPGGTGSSISSPLMSIQAAINAASSGDTVIVRGGTYPETVTLKSGVTVTNYNGEHVIVTGNQSGNILLLSASSTTNARLQGIDFDRQRIVVQDGITCIDLLSNTNLVIEYSSFKHTAEDITLPKFGLDARGNEMPDVRGLYVEYPNHFTMNGCYLYGFSHTMEVVPTAADTSFIWIKNNHFALSGWAGMYFTWSTNTTGYHTPAVLVENNLIEKTWGEDGVQWQPYYGIAARPPRHYKHLVRNNVFRDCYENALDFKAVGRAFVEGNYFYRIPGIDNGLYGFDGESGGAFATGAGDTSKNVTARGNVVYSNAGFTASIFQGFKIYNNTIVNGMRGAVGETVVDQVNNCAAIMQDIAPFVNNGIKNNIMYNNYMHVMAAGYDANLDIDYNMYSQTTGSPLFGVPGQSDLLGLATWQTHFNSGVLGKDANSISNADPEFENVPTRPTENHTIYDFTPTLASPATGAAGPLTVTTNGGTSSTTLILRDASYFRDAFGMASMGVTADSVKIAGGSPAGISSIDYTTNTIILNAARSWSIGDPVTLFKNGKEWDDIGAIQR